MVLFARSTFERKYLFMGSFIKNLKLLVEAEIWNLDYPRNGKSCNPGILQRSATFY